MKTSKQVRRDLTRIAKQHLGIRTLNTQLSDNADFHTVAVWQIESALIAAFAAGARAWMPKKWPRKGSAELGI